MTADPQGQAWVDKGALTEAVAKLSAAVDRADRDAIIDCDTADSYDDHGVFKGSGAEWMTIKAFYRGLMARIAFRADQFDCQPVQQSASRQLYP